MFCPQAMASNFRIGYPLLAAIVCGARNLLFIWVEHAQLDRFLRVMLLF